MRSDVPGLVKTHNPDLVIITLGGNELKIRDPSSRAEAIRRLVGFVGDRPCVWVAPSLWRRPDRELVSETGLLQVIRDNAKPCRYFDTNAIVPDLERTGDRVHPSIPARRVWARAFVAWLERERDPSGSRPWQLRPER
jgi:lysophospholipase L1-like esterase